jgi:chromate transporter
MIGCQSFGGGVSAWIRREVVDKRHWLEDEPFLAGLAICQIAPGPNPMNLAIFIGAMLRGWVGALVAFAGLMLVPSILVLAIGAYYFSHSVLPGFELVIGGLGAVAIGMNAANGIRLSRRNVRHVHQAGMVLLVALVVGLTRVPLFAVLAVAVPTSILVERYLR